MKTKLLALLAFLAFPFCAWANGVKIKGIYYVLDSSTKTAMVTYSSDSPFYPNPDATAYKGNITIPASVTYGGTAYRVTKIGNYAFDFCSSLTSVSIPNSVTTIGACAFSDRFLAIKFAKCFTLSASSCKSLCPSHNLSKTSPATSSAVS